MSDLYCLFSYVRGYKHIERNNAFINLYLEKKQAEQEAIRKSREEKRIELSGVPYFFTNFG